MNTSQTLLESIGGGNTPNSFLEDSIALIAKQDKSMQEKCRLIFLMNTGAETLIIRLKSAAL